jgi:hypothetical protein
MIQSHWAMLSCGVYHYNNAPKNIIHPLVKTLGVLSDAISPSRYRCIIKYNDERPFSPSEQGCDIAFRGNSQMNCAL